MTKIGDGVRVRQTYPYWPPETGDAEVGELVPYGSLMVPEKFATVITEYDPDDIEHPLLQVVLFYTVEQGEIRLIRVWSDPLDVNVALSLLRSEQSIDGWKSLALGTLAAKQAATDGHSLEADARAQLISSAIRTASKQPVARRRNRITDELLQEVAGVYREAWQAGRGPTQAVAEHFHASYSTAARWVGLAREGNHLGPPAGPRGGELT